MGLADFLLENEKGRQRFGLTRRDSALPFGRSGLYELGLNKTPSQMSNTAGIDNQANIVQGALIPGQQPDRPFNMAAVNDAGDGGMAMKPTFDADAFARLAGAFGAAIAGKDTWQGRLGAVASQLASENIKKREEAPDVALKRRKTEAEIKKLERPDTIKDTRPTKQKLYEYRKGLSGDDQAEFDKVLGITSKDGKTPTKLQLWEARNKLSGSQRDDFDRLVMGAKTEKKAGPSFFDQQDYKALQAQNAELMERMNTPDEFGEMPSEEDIAAMQEQLNANIEAMSEIRDLYPSGGGMSRSGSPEGQSGAGQLDMESVKKAIQQAKDAGIPIEQVQSYWSSPGASVEGFAKQFLNQKSAGKPGEAVAAEIPNMKNQPITTTSGEKPAVPEGMQRQKIPYNTSMTNPNTPEQETAAIQELTDLAHKLGVGPGNWKALGTLAKDLGGWAWDSYQNAFNSLTQGLVRGQKESRKQLPAYQ